MTPESLEKLTDEELVQLRERAAELLKERDTDRKNKALEQVRKIKEKAEAEARALLASVGLGPKAAAPKKRNAPGKTRAKAADAKQSAPTAARKAG